jgi:hypothetical protein
LVSSSSCSSSWYRPHPEEHALLRASRRMAPFPTAATSRHTPRKRSIQYAAASRFHHRHSRILDHPLARMMTKDTGSFRDALFGAGPESILPAGVIDSGLARSLSSGAHSRDPVAHPERRRMYSHTFAISPRISREFCSDVLPSDQKGAVLPQKGAGNAGRPTRPQPRMQNKKAYELVTTVTPDSPGIPRAMVLTLISCSPR